MSVVDEASNASNTPLPTPPASTGTEGSPPSNPSRPDVEAAELSTGYQGLNSADPNLDGKAQPTDLKVEVPVQDAETKSEDDWGSAASLFCPRNGRSHATILDFGFKECPKCDQDLTTKRISCAEPESPSSLPDEEHNDQDPPAVTYSLEIRDDEDNVAHKVPSSKPFDLSMAKKDINLQHAIYNVTTVLETSLRPYRCIFSDDEIKLLEQGIVDIAGVDVGRRSTRVTIYSKSLIKAISRVVNYYPSAKLGGDLLYLDEPYQLIAHYFDELEAYRATYSEPDVDPLRPTLTVAKDSPAQSQCDKEAFDHLGLFLDYFKTSGYISRINDEKARHSQNLCTFRMLWLLFKPGETVYMVSAGQMLAYVVKSVEVDRKVLSTPVFTKSHIVHLWNLQYDGEFVGRSSEEVSIAHFDGERPITSLKIFPCQFIDKNDGGKTRENLEQLGQKWYEMLQGRQVMYSGEFVGPSKRQVNIHSLHPA